MTLDIRSSSSKEGRRLSRNVQLAAVVLAVVVGGVAAALIGSRADQPEGVPPAKSAGPPGTFRPTQQQWRGLKLDLVTVRAFRPERVTEGTIAVDDDLTTPVFALLWTRHQGNWDARRGR
jgi:cobalt-zinc-cadmium efflux system membrane fusion protein